MGKDEEWILQQARKTNQPIPKTLLEAPDLLLGLEIYWLAFCELSTCRPAAFSGLLPIPSLAVIDYALASDFDEEQTEKLLFVCRRMDAEFMKWHSKKHGKGIGDKPDKTKKAKGLGRGN